MLVNTASRGGLKFDLPCSSCAQTVQAFPASCPHFLPRFQQELESGKAGASEEANGRMKSKG